MLSSYTHPTVPHPPHPTPPHGTARRGTARHQERGADGAVEAAPAGGAGSAAGAHVPLPHLHAAPPLRPALASGHCRLAFTSFPHSLQLLRLGLAHAREGIAWHCRVFLRISQSQLAPSVPRPSVTSTNSRLGLADGIEAVAMARPWPSQRLSRILKSQRDPLLPIPRVQMLRLGLADSREPTPVPTSEVHAYLPAYDSLGPYRPASSATPDLSPTAGRERAVGDEFVGSAIFHPSAFATLFQSDTLLNYLSEVRSSSQTPSSTTSLRCAHLLNYLSEDGSSSAPNSLDSSYGGHPVAAGAEDTEVHGWDGVIWGDVM
ncbi:unnamed protein product [Closterium sp. NIES-64]|nr:unnamed protein product [Closterium sp. NIES-64]